MGGGKYQKSVPAEDMPLAMHDAEKTRSWQARQRRADLAVTAIIRGWSARQYMTALVAYAEYSGDDHPLYYIGIDSCRTLLERARVTLAKDLSKSRLTEYAKHQSRLENLYRRAIEREDDQAALAITREQIALSQALHGVALSGQDAATSVATNRRIDRSLGDLAKALAGVSRPTRGAAAGQSDGAETGTEI